MYWKIPHLIKVYEALGALADRRVILDKSNNRATVFSSSLNKQYEVSYQLDGKAITANDNASYWKKEMGYPSIAVLILLGELERDVACEKLLKGIKWKDLNQKFKNEYGKTIAYILIGRNPSDHEMLEEYSTRVIQRLKTKKYKKLGKIKFPPSGY